MSSVAQRIQELIAVAWWDAISQDEQYIFLRDQRQYSKLKLRPINPGNTIKFDIIAVDSGENLGSISISSQGWPFVDLAMLKKEYIGKNLATEIYNALEHRIKRPIIPSPLGLSDKATKFWQRRLAAMPVEHAKQLLDESLAAGKSYGIRDKHIIDRLQPLLAEWQPPNSTARIQELSAKRLPGAAPTMFWHGTSSKFLRSIMLNGLDPAKIKEGNWRVDPAVNEINPSKISYGGIYYAKSAYTAKTYADQIARKDDSSTTHPLLVAVRLTEISTLPDEDRADLNPLVLEILNRDAMRAAEILVMIVSRTELKYYGGSSNWRNYIEKFRQLVFDRLGINFEEISKRQDQQRFYGAIDAVLLAGARRFLAHTEAAPHRKSWDKATAFLQKALRNYAPKLAKKYTKVTPDGETLVLPGKLRPIDPQKAELDFIDSANYLIKLLRNYVRQGQIKPDKWGSDWRMKSRTLRKDQIIGFRGRNKIISILEFVAEIGWYKPGTEQLWYIPIKVHYGQVPMADFLPEFRERYSATTPIVWLNKSGKQIGSDDPANKLEAGKDYSQTNKMTVAARLLELHAAAIKSSPLKLNAFNEGSEHLALLEEYQASGRKGANSTDINQHLSGRQKLSGKALKVAQRSIRHIDKIFAMQPAQHAGGHVYRAVVINPDEFQIGKTYRSNAYTSTSTNRKYITRTFFRPNKKANSSYVLFNLNLPPNYPLLNLSKWGDEGEHLLPRGIKFRVIDKRINSGYTEIYLDVYPK